MAYAIFVAEHVDEHLFGMTGCNMNVCRGLHHCRYDDCQEQKQQFFSHIIAVLFSVTLQIGMFGIHVVSGAEDVFQKFCGIGLENDVSAASTYLGRILALW